MHACRGLQGLRSQTITKTAEELADHDYTLVDLQDCQVMLLGPMSALRMHKLRGCHIYSGPVPGATFVEGELGSTSVAVRRCI